MVHLSIENYLKQIADSVEIVKKDITKLARKVLCTVILVDVHNRDCMNKMLEQDVTASLLVEHETEQVEAQTIPILVAACVG